VGTSSFRDLHAYKHAVALADRLHAASAEWDSFDRWSVGIQLTRAADSVGANIAEASGRWHRADRLRLLFIARGSLHETEHWILRARERGLLTRGYESELAEVARTLNGLMKRPVPES